MHTYDNYLSAPDSLTFDDMSKIHKAMLDDGAGDEVFAELYNEMFKAALMYTELRVKWSYISNDEKYELDKTRTMKHNAFISTLTPIVRYLDNIKKSPKWAELLFNLPLSDVVKGDKETIYQHRKRLGDFANYLSFVSALNER